MNIVVHCPGCRTRLTLGGDRRGRALDCPRCRHVVHVPTRPSSSEPPAARSVRRGALLCVCAGVLLSTLAVAAVRPRTPAPRTATESRSAVGPQSEPTRIARATRGRPTTAGRVPETTFATARRELPAPPVVHPTGAPARAFEVVDSRIVAATNRAQLDPVTGNRAYDLTRAASRSHIWTLHSWGRRELGPSRYAPVQTSWREYDPRRGGHPMTFHAFDSNS